MKLFKKSNDNFIHRQRSKKEKIIYSIVLLIFVFYAITLIYPMLWLFYTSLKDGILYEIDTITNGVMKLPKKLVFSNYMEAFSKMQFKDISFLTMIFNSVWFIAFSILPAVLMNSIVGYCLSKYRNRVTKFIYIVAIFSMTLPIVGSGGAMFKLVNQLGLYNTPLYPIITNLSGFGFAFLIMYGYFSNVSWTYNEAVFIDGGGHFTAFFKIVLPQAGPPILTLCIINGIQAWNNYMTPLLYMPGFPTVASGLYQLQYTLTRGFQTIYYAGLVIAIIPVVILFSIFSDVIMKNFTMGGLKG